MSREAYGVLVEDAQHSLARDVTEDEAPPLCGPQSLSRLHADAGLAPREGPVSGEAVVDVLRVCAAQTLSSIALDDCQVPDKAVGTTDLQCEADNL